MDILTLLIIVHLIGTILGVGGATFIEIFLNKALRDGHMDPVESDFMATTFSVVRWGLIISLLSGFGFLLLYKFTGQTFRLYDPVLWAKMTIIGVIAVNTVLLQMHKISLYWGSALSFVSWYSAAILGVFLSGPASYSYVNIMVVYIATVLIGSIVLDLVRKSMKARV